MKKIDPQTREVLEKGTMQIIKSFAESLDLYKRMWEFISSDAQRLADYMEFEIEHNSKKEDKS